MRSCLIVTTPPPFDQYPGFHQAAEDFGIQTLLAKRPVETLVATVLPGLPGLDVGQQYPSAIALPLQSGSEKLSTIVATNGPGFTQPRNQPLQR